MSQIGYMMLGAGLGVAGYAFAIFHLLTHGFFKANMFLGAGSVMHGMDDDVDMRHYGALQKAMPVTFLTFAMGYLAIIGFPGFSGFWSKDKIIETALADSWVVGGLAMLGAGITGFYMTRLMLMTFFTEKRWEKGVHPHESPKVMTIPLIVLAALSVLGGLMLLGDWIVEFLAPVTGDGRARTSRRMPALAVTLMVVAVVAIGVGDRVVPGRQARRAAHGARRRLVRHPGRTRRPLRRRHQRHPGGGSRAVSLVRNLTTFDQQGVDGVVEGGSKGIGGIGMILRRTQNGYVRSYALSLLGGALLVVLALLAVNYS